MLKQQIFGRRRCATVSISLSDALGCVPGGAFIVDGELVIEKAGLLRRRWDKAPAQCTIEQIERATPTPAMQRGFSEQ